MNNIFSKIDLARFEKLYDDFDKGHDRRHMKRVRNLAVSLAKKYCPNQLELIYIAATLHDIGLSKSREDHEINGAQMIKRDEELNKVLTKEEIKKIVHAVKEHRATTGNPKTILAKVLSDADRTSDTTIQALKRAFEHGKNHFPNLSENEQIMRSAEHLVKKYGPGGHGRRDYFPESESRVDKINFVKDQKTKRQLAMIKKIFQVAQNQDKFIFIKGGWNIDLSFGRPTRHHKDIDFHFNKKDKNFWKKWFKKRGFMIEEKDDWYLIFSLDDIAIDFEAMQLSGQKIIWKHGHTSKISEVVEDDKYLGNIYKKMKLYVEEYLKHKSAKEGKKLRKKDLHDLAFIKQMKIKKPSWPAYHLGKMKPPPARRLGVSFIS